MMKPLSSLNEQVYEKDEFEGWWQYPSSAGLSGTTVNLQSYNDRLSHLRSALFSVSPLDTDVEVIDILRDPIESGTLTQTYKASKPRRRQFCNSEDFEQHIIQSPAPKPKTTIISLHSKNSLEPLKITEESLRKILFHLSVGTEFLDLLFAFGGKPRDSEAGLGGMTVAHSPDGTYDICYLLTYVEENRGKTKVSWPIRQTAVFHRFVPDSDEHLWILIHPMPNSILQNRFVATIAQANHLKYDRDLLSLHSIVLSSYIDNWRWYLKALSEEFEEIADMALTLDFSRPEDYAEGFTTLTKLQYLQERILPLTARLQTSSSTAKSLQTITATFQERGFLENSLFMNLSNSLKRYDAKYCGHITSVELLKSRVQGVLKLLSVALNLKNQATSVDINHNMLLLTRDTVDDSATVRVVTLVTLIYLPASFIASLLGTNLFSFGGSDSSIFQISRQFWIFIALSVPLTVLTVGSWFYIGYKRKRNRELQARAQKQRHPGMEV